MRERVQVQPPQGPQALRTSARPGAVNAGAPQMERPKSLQLAQALSAISPAIQQELDRSTEAYKQQQSERAYDTIQGLTYDEARDMVEAGNLRETENPWFEAAFQKQFGMVHAGKRKREIMLAYEGGFDKYNGDLESFIAAQVKRDALQFGENKFVRAGIREGMGDFLTRLRDNHAEFRSEMIKETTVEQFGGVVRTVVDDTITTGSDPSGAARALYNQYRQTFGLTYQQMDDAVISLAEEYAQAGDVATVEALLTTNIVGEDGQQVGSFTTRTRYADKAQQIINQSKTVRGDLDRQANTAQIVGLRTRAAKGGLVDADLDTLNHLKDTQQISQEMHESLLVQNNNAKAGALNASFDALAESDYRRQATEALYAGTAFALTDMTYTRPDGKVVTLGRDQALEAVVNETLNGMSGKYTEGEMAATLASWGVGETYQIWENALSDGYLALGQALMQAGPEGEIKLPPAALAAYGTWRNLSEYPNVRARHVKDSTALNVYRDAEALERGGMDPQTALLSSARIDRDAVRDGLSRQVDRNAFATAIRQATSTGWFSADVANAGWVSSTVERSARILMDLGLPMDKAVKEASRLFEDSHTVINGVAINTRNKLIPPNFSSMSEMVLDDFANAHNEDVRDLTLVPSLNGEQTWIVARRDTLMPHEEWANGGSFNISELQTLAREADSEASAAIRERANDKLNRTQDFRVWSDKFKDLPSRHQRNILRTPVGSPEWKKLQEQFGVDIYPDGGFPHFSYDWNVANGKSE